MPCWSVLGERRVSLHLRNVTFFIDADKDDRTLRAMISENSTKKTQARAFSYFAFTSNCGIFLGPFIGNTPLSSVVKPEVYVLQGVYSPTPLANINLFLGEHISSRIIHLLFPPSLLGQSESLPLWSASSYLMRYVILLAGLLQTEAYSLTRL
jgi:hypothetical protein